MERNMKIRKWIIYSGVFFLALSTVITIVSTSSRFNAQVAKELCFAETDVNGDGVIDEGDCEGGGTGGGTTYTECPTPTPAGTGSEITGLLVGRAKAITNETAILPEECVCEMGPEPMPVPQSVEDSKTAANNQINPLPGEVDQVKSKTKLDVEFGSVKDMYTGYWTKVYDTKAQAEREIRAGYNSIFNSYFKPNYYENIGNKVNSRAEAAFGSAKGYFGYRYSTDPEKWGPTATYNTSLLRSGDASVSMSTTLGGYSYEGQPLGTGYVKTSVRGKWDISGDRLYAVAGYDCLVGDASGNVDFRGEFTGLRTYYDVPYNFKDPTNPKRALRGKVSFYIEILDKKGNWSGTLGWRIK